MTQLSTQVFRYTIIGVSAVILDAVIYSLCIKLLFFSIEAAKLTGVVSSVVYGYILNGRWTFSQRISLRNILSYCAVYGFSIALNVMVNSFFVRALPEHLYPLITGFCVATVLSVCINFLGMKFWVFR
ncbi:GtrA family protein [Desulfovibrio sp. UIB00]|uniref:GtrA family protein n=1 Tax=Desulfovibrio sp. UIB00 TaxID=2804314 RepID=UPI001F115205|nr:GtrA family protein [Desulfovibrio sp. UIB00]MCH5146291.1 GtrA family protein [Desulfovibrio sp. UIB00]